MLTFTQKQKPTQQGKTASSVRPNRAIYRQSREVSSILHLQRSIGNQAGQGLLKIDGEKREDSSLASASPHLASDFSRIPGYTSRNQARATPNELQVMHAHDMEGPAAEENIGQLADTDGGPALGPFPPAPLLYPPSPAAPLGPIAATGLNVTVPTDIRAASTPTGLPNRIPPRVDTPVSVGITGWSIPMLDVTISVDGAGGGNGTVTVDGAGSVDLNASATVKLRGVDQTDVGKAGGLRLIAKQGTTVLASSAGGDGQPKDMRWWSKSSQATTRVRRYPGT